jgi:hypothetical protein
VLKPTYPVDKLEKHLSDVDEPFEWSEIEEVGVLLPDENDESLQVGIAGEEGKGTKCPICLDRPRAPR